VLSGRSC